jgi:hypothetical protein
MTAERGISPLPKLGFRRKLRVLHVREDARPASRQPIGAWWWGELFLLVLAANTIIATVAWMLVGLLLNQFSGSQRISQFPVDQQVAWLTLAQ